MQGVDQVNAVGEVVVGVEIDEAGAGQHPRRFQDAAQRRSGPLGNRRPTLLAGVPGDLRPGWQPPEVGQTSPPGQSWQLRSGRLDVNKSARQHMTDGSQAPAGSL